MLDPSVRAQYDISYVRSFMGTDMSEKKGEAIDKILSIICVLWFFVYPTVMAVISTKTKVMTVELFGEGDTPVWPLIWLAGVAFSIAYFTHMSKKNRFNLALNASFLQELSLSDKNTHEVHSGYLFVEGYELLKRGTASAAAMSIRNEYGFKTAKMRSRDEMVADAARKSKIKENARALSSLFHEEEFQQRIANAVIRNEAFPADMNYIFFEKCRPLKKKYGGRYYAVPGNRGVETRIVVPLDCGFDEHIKEQR